MQGSFALVGRWREIESARRRPRFLRTNALSGTRRQSGPEPGSLRESAAFAGASPSALAGRGAARGPEDSGGRLRNVAGSPLCASRAAFPHHRNRHQRDKSLPRARTSRAVQGREPRISPALHRRCPHAGAILRPDRLHRRAASPSRSRSRASIAARRPRTRWRDADHGLCALRPHRDLHDAGLLPPAADHDLGARSG